MDAIDIFYAPMTLFMERPYLAAAPALVFFVTYRRLRPSTSRLLLAGSAAWLLYAAYETYMFFWSRTVIAPIRLDLFLLGPALYFVSVVVCSVGGVRAGGARGQAEHNRNAEERSLEIGLPRGAYQSPE